jgi:hypothetical protein
MKIYCEGTIGHLEHDYDLIDGKLICSDNWREELRGKTAAKIRDAGNGVKIKVGKNTITLDYSEVRELYILLAAYNNGPIEFREEKLIKRL